MTTWTQKILCKIHGHDWVNYLTHIPVRAGPLMTTRCKRCGEFGTFPQNVKRLDTNALKRKGA